MNGMVEQIHSIPGLIRGVARSYDEAVRNSVDHMLSLSVKRVYLTGCGDSHHASLGAEMAFEHIAGIPTEALTSMQYARYAAQFMPKSEPGTNLVIGTSVSGEVSRTLEALLLGKKYGATTIAMTATPGSRIGRAAEIMIDTTQPPFQDPPGVHVPGVRSYVANQIGLLLVAIRLGEVRGRILTSEADKLRKEIELLGDAAEKTIAACDEIARKMAEEWKDAREFVFVGGGPNFASALFSAAKVLEASGDSALGQDTEEWGHLQYFARQADTPTFLISAGDRDLSRMTEIAVAARQVGRRVAAVVPASASSITASAHSVLPLAEGVREMFAPVISAIPGSLFAAYRSDAIGEPFFRNFTGGRSTEGGGGISRIRTSDTEGLDQMPS
jgi:glucosamine--fructose-6-phosphate aminotransferase (isomerizing)